MPSTSLKHLAKKADVSMDRAEHLWKKAKGIVKAEYDISEDDPSFWALVTGITKKMMGLHEMITFRKFLEQADTYDYVWRVEWHGTGNRPTTTGDWHDVSLALSPKQIWDAVVNEGDVGFITSLVADELGIPGRPDDFHPHDYEPLSFMHNTMKISIYYDVLHRVDETDPLHATLTIQEA